MINKNYFDQALDPTKIRDRKDKWGMAMMLPEHVTMLKNYYEEQKKDPKPDLEEWDLEIIQESIERAMKRNVEVEIKTWREGNRFSHTGTITWVDLKRRVIEVEDVFKSFTLPLDEIIDVTLFE